MSDVKYPNIKVKLVGANGNAFMVVGLVLRALRENKVSDSERKQFQNEAMSGDYDNLIQTCLKWVEVE